MTDTIKTGTMLIEEGALMPESLRFESEPWTPFYMAGEIIRESRTALEKKASTEAKATWLIRTNCIDHYNHPINAVSLPKDNPNVGTGLVGAPECGDVMKLQIRINPETRMIGEPKFETFGFGSAIARSLLATEGGRGKTSRKRWASRTRISSASSAFPRATLLDATRYSRIGGRRHLMGSPIF
jgi:hypothetical protein